MKLVSSALEKDIELKVGDKFVNGMNKLVTITKVLDHTLGFLSEKGIYTLQSDFSEVGSSYQYYYYSNGYCPAAVAKYSFKCWPSKLFLYFYS